MKFIILLSLVFAETVHADAEADFKIDGKIVAVCFYRAEKQPGLNLRYTFYNDKDSSMPKAGYLAITDLDPAEGFFSDYNSLQSIPVYHDPQSEGMIVDFGPTELRLGRNWKDKVLESKNGKVFSCSTVNF